MSSRLPSRAALTAGIALTAGGAVLFASKGLFAKALYRQGVDFQTLTTLRALMSLPLFAMLGMGRGLALRGRPRRALVLAAVAGVLCYALGALLDFYALTLVDISVERALLFSYPALVVAWTALVRRRRPTGGVLLALVLTYAGIVLVVGGFDAAVLRQNLTGSLLVLFCASTTAAYFLLGERCIPDLGSMGFTIVAMSAAAAAVTLHYLVTHPLDAVLAIGPRGWLLLSALAVLCMFLPTLMQAEGIRRIGAVRGALAGTIGPPAALLLGVVLLGERPGPGQLAGTAMIVVGILLIARPRPARAGT
jgi:drug/metabolite transporter (DMT)-like permease